MTDSEKISGNLLSRIAVIVVDIYWYGGLLGVLAFTVVMTMSATGIGPLKEQCIVSTMLTLNFNEQATENSPVVVQNVYGPAVLRVGEKTNNWTQMAVIPVYFLYLFVAFMMRKIVRTARDGKPFTFENVRRVRLIGIIVMLLGPLQSLVHYLVALGYVEHLKIPGAEVSAGITAGWTMNSLLLGLLILVLAQVFDMGVRLQSDSDLTV